MKPCSKCGVDTLLSNFHKNKSTADGLQSQCKDCRHATRVSKWETSPTQEVVRTRNGNTQVYTRGRNHGESRTPLYNKWKKVRERCYSTSAQNYRFYGGKGVTVCDSWRTDFFSFKQWAMDSGYQSGLELDRIDPQGPYSPENCRWISKRENIKLARALVSADTAAKLQVESMELGISIDSLIAKLLEEHYS